MESQLSNWFRLAEKWGAVMLIDEADVYLEQRSKTDLHRNSLVSGRSPKIHHQHVYRLLTVIQSFSVASSITVVSCSSPQIVWDILTTLSYLGFM